MPMPTLAQLEFDSFDLSSTAAKSEFDSWETLESCSSSVGFVSECSRSYQANSEEHSAMRWSKEQPN